MITISQWCVVACHRDPKKYKVIRFFGTRKEAEANALQRSDQWQFDGYMGLIATKKIRWRI